MEQGRHHRQEGRLCHVARLGRQAAETPLEWVARLEQSAPDNGLGREALTQLRALVLAHYSLRFDPRPPGDATTLAHETARQAAAWAARWTATTGAAHRQAGRA